MTDQARAEDGNTPAAGAEPVEAVRRVRVRRRRRRPRRRRRAPLIGLGIVVLALAAVVGWLVYSAARARSELQAVRAEVGSLRSDIAAGDLAAARHDAALLHSHADAAHRLTTGPIWAAAAAVPYFGNPLDTTRTITSSVSAIADQALPALVKAAGALDPATLRGPDGRFDVAAIRAVAPQLDDASAVLARATTHISGSPAHTWSGTVDSARADLLAKLGALTKTVDSADTAVAVVPPLLGADRPMTYMVTFENDAELRGTGGLPGAFAIMRADDGKISFERFEPDNELSTASSGLHFGRDYSALWTSNPTGSYVNSNQSAHFPYAAQIWTAMWQHTSGQRLDGAIALDPTTLSYLLAVTGPAALPDGSQVSAQNVVRLTQSEVYRRFAKDNDARKRYLLDIAKAVSRKLVASRADPTALIKAAGRAASEYRLLLWTRDGPVERRLAPYPISGVVPELSAPYAGLTIINSSADKLNYYLHASLDWKRVGCGTTRDVTVTIRLRNDAPSSGLPSYVTDVNGPSMKPGVSRLLIAYYASGGATVTGATRDGVPFTLGTGMERGHPVPVFLATLQIGQTSTFVLHLREPGAPGAPTVRVQPMVNPARVTVEDATCPS